MTHPRPTLVVVGHGMVGRRFVRAAIEPVLATTISVGAPADVAAVR